MSIEAMKQMVAEIYALPEGVEWYFSDSFVDALFKLRQAIEQYEKQEPVAWGVHDQLALNKMLSENPPKREWVGLTDGQYRDIADQVIATLEDRKGVIDLCFEQELVDEIMLEVTETIKTATEAKLKEKNHVN